MPFATTSVNEQCISFTAKCRRDENTRCRPWMARFWTSTSAVKSPMTQRCQTPANHPIFSTKRDQQVLQRPDLSQYAAQIRGQNFGTIATALSPFSFGAAGIEGAPGKLTGMRRHVSLRRWPPPDVVVIGAVLVAEIGSTDRAFFEARSILLHVRPNGVEHETTGLLVIAKRKLVERIDFLFTPNCSGHAHMSELG